MSVLARLIVIRSANWLLYLMPLVIPYDHPGQDATKSFIRLHLFYNEEDPGDPILAPVTPA